MTTFDSFCERCGEPAQPPAASARGPRTGLLRALVGRRSEPAPEPALRLCLSCRGYVCANCWNEAVGQCQSCMPLQTIAAAAVEVDHTDVELGPVVVPSDGPYPDTFDQSWPVSDLSRQKVPYWPAVADDEWSADDSVAVSPTDAPAVEVDGTVDFDADDDAVAESHEVEDFATDGPVVDTEPEDFATDGPVLYTEPEDSVYGDRDAHAFDVEVAVADGVDDTTLPATTAPLMAETLYFDQASAAEDAEPVEPVDTDEGESVGAVALTRASAETPAELDEGVVDAADAPPELLAGAEEAIAADDVAMAWEPAAQAADVLFVPAPPDTEHGADAASADAEEGPARTEQLDTDAGAVEADQVTVEADQVTVEADEVPAEADTVPVEADAVQAQPAWQSGAEPWPLLSPVAMAAEAATVEDEDAAVVTADAVAEELAVDGAAAEEADFVESAGAAAVHATHSVTYEATTYEATVADDEAADEPVMTVADAGEVRGPVADALNADHDAELANVGMESVAEEVGAPTQLDDVADEGAATTAVPLSVVPAPDELLWVGLLETAPPAGLPAELEPEPHPRDIARAFRSRRLRRRTARPIRAAFRRHRALQEPTVTAQSATGASEDDAPIERAADETVAEPEQVAAGESEEFAAAAYEPEQVLAAAEPAAVAEPPPAAATPVEQEPTAAPLQANEGPPERPAERPSHPVVMPAPPRTLKLPPAQMPVPTAGAPASWTPRLPPPVTKPAPEPLPNSIIPPPARFRPHQPTLAPLQSLPPAVLPCANCGLTLSTKVSFCRRCGTRQQPTA